MMRPRRCVCVCVCEGEQNDDDGDHIVNGGCLLLLRRNEVKRAVKVSFIAAK